MVYVYLVLFILLLSFIIIYGNRKKSKVLYEPLDRAYSMYINAYKEQLKYQKLAKECFANGDIVYYEYYMSLARKYESESLIYLGRLL